MRKADTIFSVCSKLSSDEVAEGIRIIESDYPFVPLQSKRVSLNETRRLRIFQRDRFVDRYSGDRLVFPGTLLILSATLGEKFPYSKNWKTSSCHPAWWEVCATVDHCTPVVKGGGNDDENLVTTSMMRNAAKLSFTSGELGWRVLPLERDSRWDGLVGWFMDYLDNKQDLLNDRRIRRWHSAVESLD
jgi:hypothetical protein